MRIRQIVLAAQHLHASRDLLARVFDLTSPFRDPGVAEFGIDNAVFSLGDQFIEVIAPTQPDTACGRHLARYGDSGYMLILQTEDLARERARFAALGVRCIWSASFDDIQAMHLHPKDVGGAIVSIDEPRPADSWRWGGPAWQGEQSQRAADGQGVRGLHLGARDPEALARRWAQVLGLDEPRPAAKGWSLGLSDGLATFEPGDSDGVVGFTLAVSDPAAVLARAQDAGLATSGQTVTLGGAQWHLQAGLGVAP